MNSIFSCPILFIVTAPLILSFIISCFNFENHKNLVNNSVPFNANLNCPRRFTIYAVNNTGELYVAKIFKEECNEVNIRREYSTLRSGHKTDCYRDNICEYIFVQTVVSFPHIQPNSSNVNIILSSSSKSYVNTVEGDVLTLQRILREKNIAIDEINPDSKYKIEYYSVLDEKYPVVYYGIAGCDSNNKFVIEYLSGDLTTIAETIYPIYYNLIVGCIVTFVLAYICY